MADLMGKISRGLIGFGAGVQGYGPQYLNSLKQQQQQEQQIKQQQSQQRQSETAQKAAMGVRMAKQMLDQDPDRAVQIIDQLITGIPGGSNTLGQVKQDIMMAQSNVGPGVRAPGDNPEIHKQRAIQRLSAIEDRFVMGGVLPQEGQPEPYQPQSPLGKLGADYNAGLITQDAFMDAVARATEPSGGQSPAQQTIDQLRIQQMQRDLNQPAPTAPTPQEEANMRVQQDAEGENLNMLNDLSGNAPNRQLDIDKAKYLLEQLDSEKMKSGTSTALIDMLIPGKWNEQGRFNEEFDAFAERAARQQLKASGDLRPTDADVKGMKESMFGVGRSEETNIQLLKEYIASQEAIENQYQSLLTARRDGSLGSFVPDTGASVDRSTNGVAEGTVIVNESNPNYPPGAQLVYRNGEWLPL